MTVEFRWPWTPPPDQPDPDLARRSRESFVAWHTAVEDLRRALVEADEYVKAEQEDPDGV